MLDSLGPTKAPSHKTKKPSAAPTSTPAPTHVGDTNQPTSTPTSHPTSIPTSRPTSIPTTIPTSHPTIPGAVSPSHGGKTRRPTLVIEYSQQPTDWRAGMPTRSPHKNHAKPSYKPTFEPTTMPSLDVSTVMSTQTITGVSILASREDTFVNAYDDGLASALDACAAEAGADQYSSVVINTIAGDTR